MKNKIAFFLVAIITIFVTISGCSSDSNIVNPPYIGISMPNTETVRWIIEGIKMQEVLEQEGYKVNLRFSENNDEVQLLHVNEQIEDDVDILIIAAVDATTLAPAISKASEKGIKIIAYDSLLVNSDAIDYYASFDNFLIGVFQANSLIEGMKANGEAPYNIEIFSGSLTDTNAAYVYNGSMSILQPMIDSGQIIIPSNQITLEETATHRWSKDNANIRMESILNEVYTDTTPLHGVLSAFDGMSLGIIAAIKNEYTSDYRFPIITGQNAEAYSVKAIIDGDQYSTVFKDSYALVHVASAMTIALLTDNETEINDTTTYFNGSKIVPAFLCEPITITKDNYEELLIDSGYLSIVEIQNVDK